MDVKSKVLSELGNRKWVIFNKHLWKPLGDWDRLVNECLDNPNSRVSFTYNMDGELEAIIIKTMTADCWGHEEMDKYLIIFK